MSLEFRNVSKRVDGTTHIHPTDLVLAPEGFNILLGTTLSGKTTLLHLMAGLDRPTDGEIWFDGKNVTGMPTQKRNVSMVHQQFINYPNFTVFENIASPLRVARLPIDDVKSRVGRVAELLKLSPMLDRKPSELSGGQQQRTALARALVKDADLVLLDEPLANLDFKLREELRDELPRMFADRQCTVVYATSEPGEALLLGGHTATLHEGAVTQFGRTADIYRRPRDLQSATVFSDPPINTAPIRKQGDRFVLDADVHWPVESGEQELADGSYIVGIRPHHIVPHASPDHPVSLSGLVHATEFSGSDSSIHFRIGAETWVSQSRGIHPTEIGGRTGFWMDSTKCLYFSADGQRVPL